MGSNWELIAIYAAIFAGLFAFGLLINGVLLRFVKTLGMKNQNGTQVRWSSDTKPAIGGLSFYIVFLLGLSLAFFTFDMPDLTTRLDLIGVFIAASLGFMMGLTDDAYNTNPILKFSVQVICGIILVVTGSTINLFDSAVLNNLITIFWVVGIMNSINMLDNMDGIATIVSIFILLSGMGALVLFNRFESFEFMVMLAILASLAAFLWYNWFPSRIYMGDTGSQFLGVLLAYLGIHYCWNIESLIPLDGPVLPAAALLAVFTLPLCDTTVVTINRLRDGRSPFVGGKDHTTHHLSYRGLTDGGVAWVFTGISVISMLLYMSLVLFAPETGYFFLIAYPVYFLVIFLVLFGIAEYNKRRGVSVE